MLTTRPDAGDNAPASSTDRIDEAQRALSMVDEAAAGLATSTDIARLALRREAVALVHLGGASLSVGALLRFEAIGERATARVTGGAAVPTIVERACRHVDALEFGVRRLAHARRLTPDALTGAFVRLLGVESSIACGDSDPSRLVPLSVATAIREASAIIDCPIGALSPVTVAADVYTRLRECGDESDECESLAGVAFLLVLCSPDRVLRSLLAPSVELVRENGSRHGPSSAAMSDIQAGAAGSRARAADRIVRSARGAISFIEQVTDLVAIDEERIAMLGKAAHSARRVHAALQRRPVMTLPQLLTATGLRAQPATSALHRLRAMHIVTEVTGRHRNRVFGYRELINLLEDGLH